MFQLVCGLEGAVVPIAGPLHKHDKSNPERSLAVKLDKLSDLIAHISTLLGCFINVNFLISYFYIQRVDGSSSRPLCILLIDYHGLPSSRR